MAKFSQGFMDVLSRTGTPQAAMQQGQQETPAYGSLQRNLGAAFNIDQRSRPEMASAEIDKIDPNSKDALRQSLLVSAKYEQDQQRKLLMLAKVAELDQATEEKKQQKIQAQKLRESWIARAKKVGLETESETLTSGGDIDKASTVIREAEKRKALETGGLRARRQLLTSSGATSEQISDLENASEKEIEAFLSGQKGTIMPFTSADEKLVSLRVNDYGRAWDKDDNMWKNPSEMGLSPAPEVQKVFTQADNLTKRLTDVAVTNFGELNTAAQTAVDTLRNNDIAMEILDSEGGIYSGTLANFKTEAAKAAYLLSGGNLNIATAENSETYAASRVSEVGNFIQKFGSGTGLSDADREYAKQGAAGDIAVTEASIRRLLMIERQVAKTIIGDHSKVVDALKKQGVDDKTLSLFTAVPQSYLAREVPPPKMTPDEYLEMRRGGQ
jgi:hypothetical protein